MQIHEKLVWAESREITLTLVFIDIFYWLDLPYSDRHTAHKTIPLLRLVGCCWWWCNILRSLYVMSSPPDFPPLAEMNQNKHIDKYRWLHNKSHWTFKKVGLPSFSCLQWDTSCVYVCFLVHIYIYRRIEKNSFALVSFMCKHNTGSFLKLGEVFVLQWLLSGLRN